MEKTSVYLTEAERRRLAHLSSVTGRSQSEIVREAIAHYDPGSPARRRFRIAEAVGGSGAGLRDISVADIPEEELLEGFGEDPGELAVDE